MTEEMKKDEYIQGLVKQAVARYDLIFYCGPVKRPWGLDPNRIHSEAESLEIDAKIPALLSEFAPGRTPVVLLGDSRTRYMEVVLKVLELS